MNVRLLILILGSKISFVGLVSEFDLSGLKISKFGLMIELVYKRFQCSVSVDSVVRIMFESSLYLCWFQHYEL